MCGWKKNNAGDGCMAGKEPDLQRSKSHDKGARSARGHQGSLFHQTMLFWAGILPALTMKPTKGGPVVGSSLGFSRQTPVQFLDAPVTSLALF
jgi:hypothetical protein